jgi:5-deoxy-glucuronate isomerase
MGKLLRAADNHNQPIIAPGQTETDLCYFNLLHLAEGQSVQLAVPGYETLFAVLSGRVDVAVGGETFRGVGGRADVWSGQADSVYAGTGAEVTVTGRASASEVAVAGGRCDRAFAPFRVLPDEVDMVEVGSADTHSRRRIFHLLGHNGAGRAGNLLVSELRCDAGCWSGFPPHKHDQERPPRETEFQEIYHYRFNPQTGFGGQFFYDQGGDPQVVMTRNGDTFLFAHGYHPTVTSPGHEEYVFTILVGRHQRSLVQFWDPTHEHLTGVIPGLQAMRDKFKSP